MNDFEKFQNDYQIFIEETEKHFERYHSRSNKRKDFDNLTLKYLADGNDLTESIKVALQKYPEFHVSINELSLSELENYLLIIICR